MPDPAKFVIDAKQNRQFNNAMKFQEQESTVHCTKIMSCKFSSFCENKFELIITKSSQSLALLTPLNEQLKGSLH